MQVVKHDAKIRISTLDNKKIYVTFDAVQNQITFLEEGGKYSPEALFVCSGCEANAVANYIQGVASQAGMMEVEATATMAGAPTIGGVGCDIPEPDPSSYVPR